MSVYTPPLTPSTRPTLATAPIPIITVTTAITDYGFPVSSFLRGLPSSPTVLQTSHRRLAASRWQLATADRQEGWIPPPRTLFDVKDCPAPDQGLPSWHHVEDRPPDLVSVCLASHKGPSGLLGMHGLGFGSRPPRVPPSVLVPQGRGVRSLDPGPGSGWSKWSAIPTPLQSYGSLQTGLSGWAHPRSEALGSGLLNRWPLRGA